MRHLLLYLACCCMATPAWAQYSTNFQQEYFFGRLPSARAEALGGSDVAYGASILSVFQNPAAIGQIKSWQADISTAAPFYLLGEADYYFVGGAYRVSDKLAVAVSGHQFALGQTDFEINLGVNRYEVDLPKTNTLRATAAYNLLPGLTIGANIGLVGWKYINELRRTRALNLDMGLQYTRAISDQLTLHSGLSLTNVSGTGIKFKDPADNVYQQDFPTILRLGAGLSGSMTPTVGTESLPIDWLIHVSFRDLLNNAYRTGVRLGGEFTLWQVLVVRLGYFNDNNDQQGFPDFNFARVKSFTYGFGAIIPTRRISQEKLPFDVHLDFVSLPHAQTSNIAVGRIPNYRSFALRLVWDVE